jgi:hypothetical protein
VVFFGWGGTPPAGAMIFGREDGSIVSVALDGTRDVAGDGAMLILGATVKEVALSVPVGRMLCGAELVGTTTIGVNVGATTEEAAVEPVPVVMAEAEPVAVDLDSVAMPDELASPEPDVLAEVVPDTIPPTEDAEAVEEVFPGSDAVPEVCTPVWEAVPEVTAIAEEADPDAVTDVCTPVWEAVPGEAGPVADAVPEVAEAVGEPLTLVTGTNGITPELDVTGTTEVSLDVSGTGTTEVGTGDETPADDAAEDSKDETAEGEGKGVGTTDGSTEDAAETGGTELCPVPNNEDTTPLESGVGTMPTGVVDPVADPVVVDTGTAPLLGDVPNVVSMPTVIPDEAGTGIEDCVTLDRTEEATGLIAGITLEGSRPVDDSTEEPAGTLGALEAPLVPDVPTMGTTGGTTLVVELDVGDDEIMVPGGVDPVVDSAGLVAVPADVGTVLVDPMGLVDNTVEPGLSMPVMTIDDAAEGADEMLALGTTVEPTDSFEVAALGGKEVDPTVPLPTDTTEVGTEEGMTTGVAEPTEVSTVTDVGTTTGVPPDGVIVTDVAITNEDDTGDGRIVTEVGITTGDVSPAGVTVVDVTTITGDG